MNHSYRLIWSDINRSWVPVSELAKARGKRASGVVMLAAAVILAAAGAPASAAGPPAAGQLPSGGRLVAGQASIGQDAAP